MNNSKKILLASTVLAGVTAVNANTINQNIELGSATEVRTNLLSEFNSPALNQSNILSAIEGKCGEEKASQEKVSEEKAEMKKEDKTLEHKCGEGKCGEEKASQEKASEEKAEMKKEDKTMEHKCGEGKCGEAMCGSK